MDGEIQSAIQQETQVTIDDLKTAALDKEFDRWWSDEGSGMAPLSGHDYEQHVRRIARIAWHNGAYAKLMRPSG